MNMITALEAQVHGVRYPEAAPPAARGRAAAATLVAGLYVLLVLGAPLIVRYGPDPETASAPAAVAVKEAAAPRCAPGAETGNACQPATPVASH
jgi:hypothetical protein